MLNLRLIVLLVSFAMQSCKSDDDLIIDNAAACSNNGGVARVSELRSKAAILILCNDKSVKWADSPVTSY